MDFLRYCRLVMLKAWSESLDQAQAALFVAIIVGGAVVDMMPQFAQVHDWQHILDAVVSWKGAAWTLGAVVLTRFIMAPYYLWRQLTQRNTELEEMTRPKYKLYFDPDGYGIQQTPVQVKFHVPASSGFSGSSLGIGTGLGGFDYIVEHMATYVRIQIEALSNATITGCRAHLVKLEKVSSDGNLVLIPLPHGILLNETPKDVLPQVPCSIDFLECHNENNILKGSGLWPLALRDVFSEHGTYRFNIVVTNPQCSERISVDIRWSGLWDTITGLEVPSNLVPTSLLAAPLPSPEPPALPTGR